jgi:centromere protein I
MEMRTSLRELTNHISTIALSALTASESPASSVLAYYIAVTNSLSNAVSHAVDTNKSITVPVSIPTPETFYLLLFTPSPHILSQLCGLLAQLKQLLEALLRSNNTLPEALSRTLNGYLMDSCNLLWRSRAFATTDANARACLLPDASIAALRDHSPRVDRDASLAGLFGLPWHPVLGSMARVAFLELESERAEDGEVELEVRHEGPVSQRSLVVLANEGGVRVEWKEYRGKVLDWLEERGMGGIKGLIFAALKNATG